MNKISTGSTINILEEQLRQLRTELLAVQDFAKRTRSTAAELDAAGYTLLRRVEKVQAQLSEEE